MTIQLIQERLDFYRCQSQAEEDFALKEITQEIALAALSRANFFKKAAFQGGTCLRILYHLDRFSEDLDFILQTSDPTFRIHEFLKALQFEFEAFGYEIEIQDRSKLGEAVQNVFLKDRSIGKVLHFNYPRNASQARTIKIKLEIDTNPPRGSHFEVKYLQFPFPAVVTVQDLSSLFAGKCHALLCREYVKGRDWYDFIWYVAREVSVNLDFLAHACNQQGPWKNQNPRVTKPWFFEQMANKINSIDWQMAKKDISRFLRPPQLKSLEVWHRDFFLACLDKMKSY